MRSKFTENGRKVDHFKYQGTIMERSEKLQKEINDKMRKTGRFFNSMKTFFRNEQIPKNTKVEVVKKVLRCATIYNRDPWITTTKNISRINATKMIRKIQGK